MKLLFKLTLFSTLIHASIFDFNYLSHAKEAYNEGNYSKAEALYKQVDYPEAQFNVADTLYRQKKYKEALEAYNNISEKSLQFKKLHNIGNTHAQMNKIDEAIKAYEEALKIKEDSDTKFNLALLKKKKKEQEQKKNDKKDDKKNDKKSDKKDDKDKEDKNDKKSEENQKEKEDKKKKDEKKKQADEKKKEQEKEMNKEKMNEKKQPPISNMEERKWQKMLNKRGVNTLMIPLSNKGEKRNETNPW